MLVCDFGESKQAFFKNTEVTQEQKQTIRLISNYHVLQCKITDFASAVWLSERERYITAISRRKKLCDCKVK